MSFTLERGHRLLASEISIWLRLTASNAANLHFHHVAITRSSADLRIRDVRWHELLETWAGGVDEPGKDKSALDSADLSFAYHFVAACLTRIGLHCLVCVARLDLLR